MALTISAWHDRDAANHQQMLSAATAQGFSTLALSVYGDRNNPRYAAVMVKRSVNIATVQRFGLNAAQFQATFNEMSAKGFGPYLVSATGSSADPLFAACFMPMSPTPLTRHGIDGAEFDRINEQQMMAGGILKSVDAYGEPGNVRYVAVWHPNPDRVSWNCDGYAEDLGTAQQRFNAVTATGGRSAIVSVVPGDRVLQCFVDTTIGAWSSHGNMTSQQYQDEFNKAAAQGLSPVCVSASGSGASTRFAAIFAGREAADKRVFTATGPTTVAEIDETMRKYVQAENFRNASLAVLKGTRLVYTKGYTWAEPGYPAVKPTTLFRQASVSKTIAALAMYQILEEEKKKAPSKPAITLDTTVQSILKLTTPDGKPPVDPKFSQVTIRHLLESTSSVARWGIWADWNAAKAFKVNLAIKPKQLSSFIASLNLETTAKKVPPANAEKEVPDVPGDTTNVKYNNTGYYLLSQVVTAWRKANSFEEAITPTLLSPLGISRIRESKSLIGEQLADEARYQVRLVIHRDDKKDPARITSVQRASNAGPSVRTADQPLVAHQYGTWSSENHDGAGGLSAAVTDIARVVAMFSSGDANPVLKQDTLNQMLSNAAKCHKNYSGPDCHGFHGFDWVDELDPANHVYEGAKGGYLPGSQNGFRFTSGGFAFLICVGSNTLEGVPDTWEQDVRSIVLAKDKSKAWDNIDLFTDASIKMSPLVPASKSPLAINLSSIPEMSSRTIRDSIALQKQAFSIQALPRVR